MVSIPQIGKPIISTEVRDEIIKRGNLLALPNGQYITDEDNENTKFIIKKFMDCDSKCWKALNISSGLFKIQEQSYLSGVGKPSSDYDIDTKTLVNGISIGIAGIEIIKEGKNTVLESIPADEIYFEEDNPIRLKYMSVKDEEGQETFYLFKKTYKVGENTNELFELDKRDSLYGKNISLDNLYITETFKETEATNMDRLSIEVYEGDNIREAGESLVYAIERKLVASNNEIIQFVKTRLLVTNAKLNEDDINNDIWFGDDESSKIEFIQNENTHLDKSLKFIEEEKKMLGSMWKIPVSDFGLDDNGTGTGEKAQIVKRSAYINQMIMIRDIIETMIRNLLGKESDETLISWREITAEDQSTLIEVIKGAKELGLLTDVQALQKFHKLTKEEAEAMDKDIKGSLVSEPINENN